MGKATTSLLLLGGLAAVATFFVRSIKNIKDKISFLPVFDGRMSVNLEALTIPAAIVIRNDSWLGATVRLNSAVACIDGKEIAWVNVPDKCEVRVAAKKYSYLNGFSIVLPLNTLLQFVSDNIYDIIQNPQKLIDRLSFTLSVTIDNAVNLTVSKDFKEEPNLGLVAASKRNIKPLKDYIDLIPDRSALKNEDKIIVDDATTEETVLVMHKIILATTNDTRRLAQTLRKSTLKSTIQAIWDFVYDHIDYVRDSNTCEQIRRPLRTLYDQKGDCDCYATLIGSILTNLNIPFKLRIAAYYGRDYFQHVYVVVPYEGGEYVCDPVLDRCFDEKQPTNYKDFPN